jgi:protein involved in polysaccharide export with SLBB domain
LLLAVLAGCTSATDTMRVDAAQAAKSAADAGDASASAPVSPAELERLEKLWNERMAAGPQNADYPIGPGDVLEVSAPDVQQLSQRKVRVSAQGTIELPLLGIVQAGGLNEDGLAQAIDTKLEKFMYRPQVSVFVDEYRNREVAVVGAVNRPGLVLLNNTSESMLDVITQCGGVSAGASDQVIFIPVGHGNATMPRQLAALVSPAKAPGGGETRNDPASAGMASQQYAEGGTTDATTAGSATMDAPGALASNGVTAGAVANSGGFGASALSTHNQQGSQGGSGGEARGAVDARMVGAKPPDPQNETADQALQMMSGQSNPITLSLKSNSLGGAGKYLNMPMRPGDVLVVPGGGDVMVVGWVQTPGRFQAGSGLTVLGAIGAAGGAMYAADTSRIALIRSAKEGSKSTIPVNLDKISRGEEPDLPVKANDVIDVPYSDWRVGPYIFYSLLARMGLGAPAIPY